MIKPQMSLRLSILILSAGAGLLFAQKAEGRAGANEAAPLKWPARVGIFGETPITLKEAIAAVLANNGDIEAARLDQQIAYYNAVAARGVFDPRIGAQSFWERRVTPVSSSLGGAPNGKLIERQINATPRLNGLNPGTGGTYQVDFANARQRTNNQFVTLNPFYPTGLTGSVALPLLRGRAIDDSRRQIAVTRKNQFLTDAQFRQKVMDVVNQASQTYWDLVFAQKNIQVQIQAATLAERQVESNQRQADKGVLAPIQVNEAQIQLYTFQQAVYTAQANVTAAENRLKALMLPDNGDPRWMQALLPVTPVNLNVPVTPLADVLKEAIASRPELESLRISKDINDTNNKFFRNQTKPEINLTGSYTGSGLAGAVIPAGPNPITGGFDAFINRLNVLSTAQGLTPLPPIQIGGSNNVIPILVGGYSQSLSNLSGANFPSIRAGFQISIPIGNRTAEGQLGASLAEGRRLQAQERQSEKQIQAEVRSAMQSVQSAAARLDAARQESGAAQEQYESETRQLQSGVSTVFLVLQRQTALANAQSREARAETDLSSAIEDFNRATANILKYHDVVIEDAARQKP